MQADSSIERMSDVMATETKHITVVDECPGSLQLQHTALLATLNEKIDTLLERQKEIHVAVYGNGEDGLKTKVDRLEQSEGRNRRWVWVAGAAALSAIAAHFIKAILIIAVLCGIAMTAGCMPYIH